MPDLKDVKRLLGQALPVSDTSGWDKNTALLGAIPEFDSMSVLTVITLIEETLEIIVDDSDISADDFSSVGTLLAWIQRMQH